MRHGERKSRESTKTLWRFEIRGVEWTPQESVAWRKWDREGLPLKALYPKLRQAFELRTVQCEIVRVERKLLEHMTTSLPDCQQLQNSTFPKELLQDIGRSNCDITVAKPSIKRLTKSSFAAAEVLFIT